MLFDPFSLLWDFSSELLSSEELRGAQEKWFPPVLWESQVEILDTEAV
jgi:hypothetical protein